VKSCGPMISSLEASGVIQQISLGDVIAELKNRTLSIDQVVNCMRYWISYRSNNAINTFELGSFLKNLVISFPVREDGKQAASMPLANINYYVNPRLISPPTLPLPHDVMPLLISKHLSRSELEGCFGYLV
jgi:hypothetical protein